ncbi:MAG: hypothetical protein ABWX92_09385 [Mycetocola sp.]
MTGTSTLSELGGRKSIKSVLSSKLGLSTSLPETLGALAIGVIVLGGIGFGIGAGYNYTQDSSAQSTLDVVKSGQALIQSKTGSFGDKADLTTGNPAAVTSDQGKWDVAVSATGTNYCAASKSGSMDGLTYYITSKNTKVTTTKPTTPADLGDVVACPTIP